MLHLLIHWKYIVFTLADNAYGATWVDRCYFCTAEGEEEEDEDGEEEDFDEEEDDEEDEEEVEGEEDDDEVSVEDEVTSWLFSWNCLLKELKWNSFWFNVCVLKEEEFGQDGEVDEEDEDEDEDDEGMCLLPASRIKTI